MTPPPTSDKAIGPETVDDLIEVAIRARANLAEHIDVPEMKLELVSSEAVTWRDGSLGCPEVGKAYTEALVDGYLIVFETDGQQYEVHQAGNHSPVVCLTPSIDGFIPPTKKPPEISIPPPIR